MKRSRRIAVFTLFVFLAFSFSGCAARGPYHAAVTVNHDARTIVQAFQQAEIAEFQAGHLSLAEHQALEGAIEKVATAGQSVTTALQSGSAQSDVIGKVNNLVQTVSDLNAHGVLFVKNAQAKAVLTTALKGIQALLVNLQKEVGASQ